MSSYSSFIHAPIVNLDGDFTEITRLFLKVHFAAILFVFYREGTFFCVAKKANNFKWAKKWRKVSLCAWLWKMTKSFFVHMATLTDNSTLASWFLVGITFQFFYRAIHRGYTRLSRYLGLHDSLKWKVFVTIPCVILTECQLLNLFQGNWWNYFPYLSRNLPKGTRITWTL